MMIHVKYMHSSAVRLGFCLIEDKEFLEADVNDETFQHEYGHYLQSQKFGSWYLFKFGLPSLRHAGRVRRGLVPSDQYMHFWTEQDANVRAKMYFDKIYGGSYTWHSRENKIFPEAKALKPKWYERVLSVVLSVLTLKLIF